MTPEECQNAVGLLKSQHRLERYRLEQRIANLRKEIRRLQEILKKYERSPVRNTQDRIETRRGRLSRTHEMEKRGNC